MKATTIIVNNTPTHYYASETVDTENCLLFLHGWGQDGKSFEAMYRLLEEKDISYIGLDFPGFGKTSLPAKDLTIEDYAQFTKDFIQKLGLKAPILIGHSFGGRVSIVLGSRYENLKKIVLIGGAGIKTHMNPGKLWVLKCGKFIFSLPGLKTIGKKIRESLRSRDYNSAGEMEQIFLNTINTDLSPLLTKISFPTLLIRGGKDTETPLSEGTTMHENIPNSELQVIPEGDHFVFQAFPEQVTDYIVAFTHQ